MCAGALEFSGVKTGLFNGQDIGGRGAEGDDGCSHDEAGEITASADFTCRHRVDLFGGSRFNEAWRDIAAQRATLGSRNGGPFIEVSREVTEQVVRSGLR